MGAQTEGGWAVEQLTAYLYGLADAGDGDAAVLEAIDRAAEAMEAEVAALVIDGAVSAAIGFASGKVPEQALLALAAERPASTDLPGLGACHVSVAYLDSGMGRCLLVARTGDVPFSMQERNLLRGMGRALALNIRAAEVLGAERSAMAALQERQTLMERLTRIQRSINSRAPLPDVLQTIVAGAAELIGDQYVALRTIDANDPGYASPLCSIGVSATSSLASRIKIGDGAGGRAIAENRLVVIHDYSTSVDGLPGVHDIPLQAAMAAPVHENAVVVGSLVVASLVEGRTYSVAEQETLLSFADHVSLALTDAMTVESLRQALDAARHDALHDELTQLPNRALLRERLDQAWTRGRATGSPMALLFLDFDDFKDINDSLGHDAGDQLLVALAGRLADSLRPGDTIARLGGDEFAVLIENLAGAPPIEGVARRLLDVLTVPVDLGGRYVSMRGSIGIAVADYTEKDSQSLLYSADLAMYEAKRKGGGRSMRYQPDMHQGTLERLDIEQALKIAINQNQLVLHYQPIEDLRTGAIVGAEALVRWQHPVRGLIGPMEFVPVAESGRLITALGTWVLRTACEQAARWPGHIEIAVNLSPRQLEPSLPRVVRDILAKSGLSADRLTLEVTEGTAMADAAEPLRIINELHSMGVHFAIDDFGTGYSSLARLQTLPVDQLKIDQSFVNNLDADSDGGTAVLISAIVALAHGSDLIAVAEGVETAEQRQRLVELGCDRAQGYLLSRPVVAEAMSAMLGVVPRVAAVGDSRRRASR
jgi:diguanylate cyclase (GGDEF)-like protein